MAIKQLPQATQSALYNALCTSLGGWKPSEHFRQEFQNFEVSELSQYFDVSKYLK